GRQHGFRRVVELFGLQPRRVLLVLLVVRAHLTLVRDQNVEDREERLRFFGTVAPVRRVAGVVPHGVWRTVRGGRFEVVIGLGVVRAVIPGGAQVFGE